MSPRTSWHPPPPTLPLGRDEVHVWRASLDPPASKAQTLQSTLATDELERAERYHFQRDRRRFIVARGVLRAILGRYTGMEPLQLRFCYGFRGKPMLAREHGTSSLRFNVSHSCDLALYAVTRDRKVGIDLERIQPDLTGEELAERFFSPREVAILRALPRDEQPQAFLSCWTRKEAYIKARGDGLALPLDRFDVSFGPGEPAALLGVKGDPQEAARWSLQELEPGPGYVAALAVEGHDWQLRCWQWTHAR